MSFEAKEVIVTQLFLLVSTLLGIAFQIWRENRERRWRREAKEEEMLHWERVEREFRDRNRDTRSRTRASDIGKNENTNYKRAKRE